MAKIERTNHFQDIVLSMLFLFGIFFLDSKNVLDALKHTHSHNENMCNS